MSRKDRKHSKKHEPESAVRPEAPETAGQATEAGQPAELRKTLDEQAAQVEQLQRALADLDNRRKRMERQMIEAQRFALQTIVVDLLPVIDNFERALGAAEETRDFDALHDGLKLVHDQLLGVLKKHHVTRIEALGQTFDPNHHEAVGQMESADHPDQTIIDVHQEGYQLHDRVVRPSSVIVSRRPVDTEPRDVGRNDEDTDGQ
ncbi:MAG: nucleotide exchange factor GrpE [Anaerolineaceae bacterium]|nr:nucleotide exchange factor GrpE [Anaerolineaceae bacterium]